MTISLLPRSFRARLVGAGLTVGAVVLGLLFITNLLLIERYLDHQTNARTDAIVLAYRTAVTVPLASRDYATFSTAGERPTRSYISPPSTRMARCSPHPG